jgi:protein disulfide isomerase family A protein 3
MLKAILLTLILTTIVIASDVFEYGDEDFDSKIGDHVVALVEFYSPNCGFCVRLAPEYEIAATKLKNNNPQVALVKVDCTVNKNTCSEQKTNGYPTLRIFKNGVQFADYEGPRDAAGIVNYMQIKIGPPSIELTSANEMENYISSETGQFKFIGIPLDCFVLLFLFSICSQVRNLNFYFAYVGYFSDADSLLAKEFGKIAAQYNHKYSFAHITNPDVLSTYGKEYGIQIYFKIIYIVIFIDLFFRLTI